MRNGVVALVLGALTAWSVRGTGFDLGELFSNLKQAQRLIDDSLPPAWGFLPRLWDPFLETLQIAYVSAVVGGLIALPLAVLSARPIAPLRAVYLVSRNAMNLLRTMPDLFWAMLFASAVGFGPFAGTLALSVFTVAVVAKLLSESMEAIDLGVLEAVRASGGGWFETVAYGVLPQVLPQYVSYLLYAFELNIRASVVLGLVGAGGVGVVLKSQLAMFDYARVTMIVLAIFVVVLMIETVSEFARRRLVGEIATGRR